ncbi:MAG: hypothetical protein IKL04_03485 [Lachnospiraceae bacterium]|nr:hypothetical protein [Lachnospiraceae bacterium]
MMKRIAHVYIIIFPYLFVAVLYGLLMSISETGRLILLGLLAGFMAILIVAAIISADIISAFKLSPHEACVWNLVTKAVHMPAHLFCYLLLMGMMNPFLLLISWVPLLLSLCLQGISGFASIGACVGCCRKKVMGKGLGILCSLLSFIYILDMLVAIGMVIGAAMAKNRTHTD